MVFEVVDNSIDEALVGYATTCGYDPRRQLGDGRGQRPRHPRRAPQGAQARDARDHHDGPALGREVRRRLRYKVSGGLHGVGVSVVNALSKRLDVEVRRDGKVWEQPTSRASAWQRSRRSGPPRRPAPRSPSGPTPRTPRSPSSTSTVSRSACASSRSSTRASRSRSSTSGPRRARLRVRGGIRTFVEHLNKTSNRSTTRSSSSRTSRTARATRSATPTRNVSKSRCSGTRATPNALYLHEHDQQPRRRNAPRGLQDGATRAIQKTRR